MTGKVGKKRGNPQVSDLLLYFSFLLGMKGEGKSCEKMKGKGKGKSKEPELLSSL